MASRKFIDPITGNEKTLFKSYSVDPSSTGQTWIFSFEDPHTFEFELAKDKLVINCAGNCGGIDGVIRILLTGRFELKSNKEISGKVKQVDVGSWFSDSNQTRVNFESIPSKFGFSSSKGLIKALKNASHCESCESHHHHKDSPPSEVFGGKWWESPFEKNLIG